MKVTHPHLTNGLLTKRISKEGYKSAVYWVGPKVAVEILESRNHRNRPMKKQSIAIFQHSLQEREWELTGQPVIFGTDGSLLDGQNRMQAIIDSQIPMLTAVVTGIRPSTQIDMDSGAIRSVSDNLGLLNEKDTDRLASTLRTNYMLVNRRMDARKTTAKYTRYTSKRAVQDLAENPDIRRSSNHFRKRIPFSMMPSARAAALHYRFAQAESFEKANEFFDQLFTLDGTKHPIIRTLQTRLIQHKASRSRRINMNDVMALTINAWNTFIGFNSHKKLRVRSAGSDFPKIRSTK